jgi:hypothetical protein
MQSATGTGKIAHLDAASSFWRLDFPGATPKFMA